METEQIQIASAETGYKPWGFEWVGHCCCSCCIQNMSAYAVVRLVLRMPQDYRPLLESWTAARLDCMVPRTHLKPYGPIDCWVMDDMASRLVETG